jgi:hypothetical protein
MQHACYLLPFLRAACICSIPSPSTVNENSSLSSAFRIKKGDAQSVLLDSPLSLALDTCWIVFQLLIVMQITFGLPISLMVQLMATKRGKFPN